MEGYQGNGTLPADGPETDHANDAPSAEPGLETIEAGVSHVDLVPEWDARRSVIEKLALLQESKRRVIADTRHAYYWAGTRTAGSNLKR
jgi:hypothetical protein